MTGPDQSGARSHLRGPARAVRRVLAPAALELQGELPGLRAQLTELLEQNQQLLARVAALEEQAGSEGRLTREVAEIRDGLHEARRLNLRVAELTDLVTELVLPLHDREIDPSVLERLRPETL